MLNGLDLFSGIGGITLALAPWVRPIAYCENDRYAQGVLLNRMRTGDLPCAPIWDDISTLDGKSLPLVPDIIYGGFPCQDISIAGAGAGLGGDRSRLFFELARLIGELRPRFIFLENVPAISLRGLDRVLLELTALGYCSRWTTLSAGELGAPHLRERWWLLAHANGEGFQVTWREPLSQGEHYSPARDPIIRLVQGRVWEQSACHICGMDDGISPKTHRLRALGNAVVPLQARVAFKKLIGIN